LPSSLLLKGLFEVSKYFYKIELCNFTEKKTNYNREFSSDFQNGECWGYNRFYKIENLDKEGFLDPLTGKIKLKFYVRPQTYTQLCRDQKNYILSLEKKVAENNNQPTNMVNASNQVNPTNPTSNSNDKNDNITNPFIDNKQILKPDELLIINNMQELINKTEENKNSNKNEDLFSNLDEGIGMTENLTTINNNETNNINNGELNKSEQEICNILNDPSAIIQPNNQNNNVNANNANIANLQVQNEIVEEHKESEAVNNNIAFNELKKERNEGYSNYINKVPDFASLNISKNRNVCVNSDVNGVSENKNLLDLKFEKTEVVDSDGGSKEENEINILNNYLKSVELKEKFKAKNPNLELNHHFSLSPTSKNQEKNNNNFKISINTNNVNNNNNSYRNNQAGQIINNNSNSNNNNNNNNFSEERKTRNLN